MKDEVRLNVKMPNDLLQKVKSAANKKNISVSVLVRLLLIHYLEQYENESNTIDETN